MRRVSRRVLAVLIVLLAISVLGGCNWLLSPFNHMNIDGTRYRLDDLYVLDFGQFEGHYLVGLAMVSDGIQVRSVSDVRGSGEELGFVLISRSSDLDNGAYRFGSTLADFTLAGGYANVNADYDRWEFPEEYYVTGGTVDLRKTLRDGYVLQFNLRAVDDDTGRPVDIDGRFRGLVEDRFDFGEIPFSESPMGKRFNFSW